MKNQRSALANELLESVLDEQSGSDQNGESEDSMAMMTSGSSMNSSGGLSSSIEVTNVFVTNPLAYGGGGGIGGANSSQLNSGHIGAGPSLSGAGGYARNSSRQEHLMMGGAGSNQQSASGSNSDMVPSGSHSNSAPSNSNSLPAIRHTRQQASPPRTEQPNPIRKRLRRGRDAPAS